MDELIAFVRAQLDDDEAWARGASRSASSRWLPVPTGIVEIGPHEDDLLTNDRDVAYHIARWDPARVLADVAAKRQLLAWLADCEEKALDGNWWNLGVLDAVKSLAQPYAGQDGWREEWAL